MRRLMLGLAVLLPSVAVAQEYRFELVPTIGYAMGGNIVVEDRTFTTRDVDVDVDSGGTYGLRFDVGLTSRLKLELLLSRMETQFEDEKALFGEEPGGFFPAGTEGMLDLDLLTYHLGLLYQLNDGWTRWHLAGSVGITEIDPNLPLPDDDVLSASVGGGVTMDLDQARHFGLRFEARYLWIDTDDSVTASEQFSHRDCGSAPCTYTYRYDSEMTQLDVSLGLVIRF